MGAGHEVSRTRSESTFGPVCVVCAARTPEFDACCSSDCVRAAAQELQRNKAVLRRLRMPDAPSETRLRLAERNGRLSSALLRWRPPRIDLTAVEGRRTQQV
jgi:hypothetical protein